LLFWAICLVLSGGIGNMIDRIFRSGNVIDFLHFEFWPQFPVFNVADCGIVIGAGLLILHFIIEAVNEYKARKQVENAEN
jgi:signal peptidase II